MFEDQHTVFSQYFHLLLFVYYIQRNTMFATHSSSPFLFVSAATLYSSNTQHDLVSGKHSYKVCSGGTNQNKLSSIVPAIIYVIHLLSMRNH